jgi:ankyrin repeat protein
VPGSLRHAFADIASRLAALRSVRNAAAAIVIPIAIAALPQASIAAALADAVERGDLATVEALLATEAGRARIDEPAGYGMTALLFAVQADEVDLAHWLIDSGADPNRGNIYEITPLWLAATNRSPAMTEMLLSHEADATFKMSHGENAVMAAARSGDAASIRLLLAAGGDPNASESLHGETALMWAAAENHGEAIRALVAGGADPDRQAKPLDLAPMDWVQIGMVSTILPVGGWSALMYAARENALDAALALAEVGANLDLRDADGTTALGFAIMNRHYDLAAALLEAGADPDVADRTGMTALYGAVDMAFFTSDIGRPNQPLLSRLTAKDVVRIALEKGADPNAQLTGVVIGRHHGTGDFSLGNGATALMRAAKGGDLDLMRMLLEAGADQTLAMANGQNVRSLVSGGGGRGRGGGLAGFGGGRGGGGGPANPEALALLDEFAN